MHHGGTVQPSRKGLWCLSFLQQPTMSSLLWSPKGRKEYDPPDPTDRNPVLNFKYLASSHNCRAKPNLCGESISPMTRGSTTRPSWRFVIPHLSTYPGWHELHTHGDAKDSI
ncbi:hypothetical protein NPIL_230671 [Nephila pilipes]|uniref:Uncharacterized protein n=1 Tax=Nephila pilipes TaxID=299642 RepID=A0A8X6U423_NEPPI|nr:hypothetical protein NPIL_230671 [Nephila pilipes]